MSTVAGPTLPRLLQHGVSPGATVKLAPPATIRTVFIRATAPVTTYHGKITGS
jgi:hypothetical protein